MKRTTKASRKIFFYFDNTFTYHRSRLAVLLFRLSQKFTMSPVLKCLLGLFIVLCFVQFIEMARIPRDTDSDTATNEFAAKLGELGASLNKLFQEEASRFKDTFNPEEFKKFAESGTQQLNQLFESFQKPGEKVSH
uniref:Uncharacterized protein n=1 Tax=Bactrocera latifrons TaxID=174628 RepID=A0A0K8U223_BACLA